MKFSLLVVYHFLGCIVAAPHSKPKENPLGKCSVLDVYAKPVPVFIEISLKCCTVGGGIVVSGKTITL